MRVLTISRAMRVAVLALVILLVSGLLAIGFGRWQAEQRALAAAEPESQAEAAAPPAAADTPETKPEAAPPPPQLVVHVAGAVKMPGVYRLEQGTRVGDAVTAAGGALPEGEPGVLNLAEPLTDGAKVYVFTSKEVEQGCPPAAAQNATYKPVTSAGGGGGGSTASTAPVGKVNVNTATAKELERVSGIGPTMARNIVEYRSQHGPFTDLSQLDKVIGIGPSTLAKISPHLTL